MNSSTPTRITTAPGRQWNRTRLERPIHQRQISKGQLQSSNAAYAQQNGRRAQRPSPAQGGRTQIADGEKVSDAHDDDSVDDHGARRLDAETLMQWPTRRLRRHQPRIVLTRKERATRGNSKAAAPLPPRGPRCMMSGSAGSKARTSPRPTAETVLTHSTCTGVIGSVSAEQDGEHDDQRLATAGRQRPANDFGQIIVDGASLADGGDDGARSCRPREPFPPPLWRPRCRCGPWRRRRLVYDG